MKLTDTANFQTILHNPYFEVALRNPRKVNVAFVHLVASDIHFGERCSKTVTHLRSLLYRLHRLHGRHRLLLRVVITSRRVLLLLWRIVRLLVILRLRLRLRWRRNRLLRLLRQRLCYHLCGSNTLYLIYRRLLIIVILSDWAVLSRNLTLRLFAVNLTWDYTKCIPVGHFRHFLNLP